MSSSEKSNCFRPPPGATNCSGAEKEAAPTALSTGSYKQKCLIELPSSSSGRIERAQAFAQSAFDSLENESELIESVIDPGEALSSDPAPVIRNPFHPQLPLENESIIALLMLSTYEYAQRGNVAKMRNRAGQAVNAAMNLGLHAKGNEEGYYAEANRRTWWMSVSCLRCPHKIGC